MFGQPAPAGDVESSEGAPRWKQRALFDAVKDAHAAARTGPRLIRLAVYDDLGGTPLGAVLHGGAGAAAERVSDLVNQRTA
jgi:hypothetical protein